MVTVADGGDVRGRIRAPEPSGAPGRGGSGFYAHGSDEGWVYDDLRTNS